MTTDVKARMRLGSRSFRWLEVITLLAIGGLFGAGMVLAVWIALASDAIGLGFAVAGFFLAPVSVGVCEIVCIRYRDDWCDRCADEMRT
jgi:uncharacterized membrane protein